jgi:ATP-binding cassette, subfamily G (WHITE), member 2, SNQ2
MLAQCTNEAGDRDWAEIWLESREIKAVQDQIAHLRESRKDDPAADYIDSVSMFAAPLSVQAREVFRRTFISYWRDTDYVIGKIVVHISTALFNGFTFFQLGTAYSDLQGRLFTIFVTLVIAPPLIQQLQPKFLNM